MERQFSITGLSVSKSSVARVMVYEDEGGLLDPLGEVSGSFLVCICLRIFDGRALELP